MVVREATPEVLRAELETGRGDLIVGRLSSAGTLANAVHEALYEERIALVCRAGHPAVALSDPVLSDLVDYPWILPGTETALRSELENVFVHNGIDLPVNRVETTPILTVRHLLTRTDALAALPALIAADDPGTVTLSFPLELMNRTVGVTLPSHGSRTPSTEALLAELRAVAGEILAAAGADGLPH
ncbi:Pca operon transcriptional activator PcaQ [Pseudonocardia sp. N23]|nr:Pca operon transcriptional activator PcaQ [Pseudonocardia sp. N23]